MEGRPPPFFAKRAGRATDDPQDAAKQELATGLGEALMQYFAGLRTRVARAATEVRRAAG